MDMSVYTKTEIATDIDELKRRRARAPEAYRPMLDGWIADLEQQLAGAAGATSVTDDLDPYTRDTLGTLVVMNSTIARDGYDPLPAKRDVGDVIAQRTLEPYYRLVSLGYASCSPISGGRDAFKIAPSGVARLLAERGK